MQGIKRDCKALPLTVRQMVVQQVQLEAIKRREAVSAFAHCAARTCVPLAHVCLYRSSVSQH